MQVAKVLKFPKQAVKKARKVKSKLSKDFREVAIIAIGVLIADFFYEVAKLLLGL